MVLISRARRRLGHGALVLAIFVLANCGEVQDSPQSTAGTTQDAGVDRLANNGTGGVGTGGTSGSGGISIGTEGCAGAEQVACPVQASAPSPDPPVAGGPHHSFSKLLTATGKLEVKHAAAAPNGDFVVTGIFYGTTEFSAELAGPEARPTGFIARFDANGSIRSARKFSGTPERCAVDDEGNAFVAGMFSSDSWIDLGGGPIQPSGTDIFFARYDAAGLHVYSGSLRRGNVLFLNDLAVDSQGRVLLVGRFSGTLRVTPEIVLASGDQSNEDGFVVMLDAAGKPAWAKHLGSGQGIDQVRAASFDAGGEPVLTVDVYRPPSFNVGTTTRGAVLVAYDSTGGLRWIRESPFPAPDGTLGPLVASGDGLLVGALSQPVLAKMTAAGEVAWTLSGATAQLPSFYDRISLAATPEGGAVLAGRFAESLRLGSATVTSAGFSDAFLAGIGPAGEVRWLQRYGGAGNESVVALDRFSDGSLMLSGRFSCAVDFGGGVLVTRTPPASRCLGAEHNWFGDSYLLRLAP